MTSTLNRVGGLPLFKFRPSRLAAVADSGISQRHDIRHLSRFQPDHVLVTTLLPKHLRVTTVRPAGGVHEIARDPAAKPDAPRPAPLEMIIPAPRYATAPRALPVEAADPASVPPSTFRSPADYHLILVRLKRYDGAVETVYPFVFRQSRGNDKRDARSAFERGSDRPEPFALDGREMGSQRRLAERLGRRKEDCGREGKG